MATNNATNYKPAQYNVQVGGASGTLTNVAPAATSGVPIISAGVSANPTFGTVVPAGGGTGLTSVTAYAPIVGGTTSTGAFQSASTGISTSGFVLTSNGSSALPSWQASGSSVTLTGDTGGGLTSTSFTLAGGHDLNTAGTGTTITFNLDNAITLGDVTPISAGSPALTATTGDIVLSSGNIDLTITAADGSTGIINQAGFPLLQTLGDNIFLGQGAGNLTLDVTSANLNIGAGNLALNALTEGEENCAFGIGAMQYLETGNANCAFGPYSGANWTTSESDNIAISHLGTVGDTGIIRIGTTGTQTNCYIAGIAGVTVSNLNLVTVDTTSGELGSMAIPASSISITGNTGGALTGSSFTLSGGSTGLSFGGSGTTETLTFAGITANGGTVSLATDATTSTINIGTGAGVKTSTFGSTNTTSGTSINAGSGNITLTAPVTNISSVINIPTTSSSSVGVLRQNSSSLLQSYGTNNLFLGGGAGNFSLTTGSAQNNVGLGPNCLASLTTSANNTALGSGALSLVSSSAGNTAMGLDALSSLATGSGSNTAVGVFAGQQLLTGTNNTLIGYFPGYSYTGTESNNICVSSQGTTGDSGVIRIGTATTHTSAYIQGVSGVSVSSLNYVTINSSTGQLGSVALTGGFTSINVQKFTSSGTYTPTSGMKYCVVEVQAAGGGGGGSTTSGLATVSAGAGGGGGGYTRQVLSAATIGASKTVTIGSGGTAGTSGGGTGGNGGDSSLSTLLVASGGIGGVGAAALTNIITDGGGNGGGASTPGDVVIDGGTGGLAYGTTTIGIFSGCGGSSYFSGTINARGVAVTGSSAGNAGLSGAGGSGAATGNGTSAGAAGGAGGNGLIVITEFIG